MRRASVESWSLLRWSEADLAVGVKSGQPRHDQRVVLEVGQSREGDHDDAKSLLQFWGDPREAANTGGDGLAAIGDREHRDRSANGVDDQQQASPCGVFRCRYDGQDRAQYGSGAWRPDQAERA